STTDLQTVSQSCKQLLHGPTMLRTRVRLAGEVSNRTTGVTATPTVPERGRPIPRTTFHAQRKRVTACLGLSMDSQ
ncbi:hypothetical protein, partial [Rhodopirellula sp. SWK7]|uniref:hypothetical protein n=1 Tax=Rhodopirellula sp. SWK7 TaxID=595460 RepID=UPI0005C73214